MTEHVDDQSWAQFHRVVDMSSGALSEWLRTRSAGEDAEVVPDRASAPTASSPGAGTKCATREHEVRDSRARSARLARGE